MRRRRFCGRANYGFEFVAWPATPDGRAALDDAASQVRVFYDFADLVADALGRQHLDWQNQPAILLF